MIPTTEQTGDARQTTPETPAAAAAPCRGALRGEVLVDGAYAAIPLAVLAAPPKTLPATAKLVYIAILDHVRPGRREAWPSVARLAAMTGSSRSTVKAGVAALAAAGLIHAEHSNGRRTVYRLVAPPQTGPESGPVDHQTGPESGPVDPQTGPESGPVRPQTGPKSGPVDRPQKGNRAGIWPGPGRNLAPNHCMNH